MRMSFQKLGGGLAVCFGGDVTSAAVGALPRQFHQKRFESVLVWGLRIPILTRASRAGFVLIAAIPVALCTGTSFYTVQKYR